MPNPLIPERRAALRNWAITQQAGLANQPETHDEWHDEWELAQDLLDLLAALETAEAERDGLRARLDRAKAAECQAALSPPGQRRDDARGELRRVLEGKEPG